ncbi:MAG: M28 family peptidase [Clostridiales bacterium]|nr:M28 family peptidase [Clostridiales bacterium]
MAGIKKKGKTRAWLAALLALCMTAAMAFSACGETIDEQPMEEEPPAVEPEAPAPEEQDETPPPAAESIYQDYIDAVDTGWAFALAMEIIEGDEYWDNRLGDRQAGSDAEHRTAEKIESVMNEIGLTDVTKDVVRADRIQAGNSGLILEGDDREIILHAYQTRWTPPDGLKADVVDVGEGTEADYEGLDVKGKIVLIDIDQRANWWIGTPVMQAIEKGAAAVLANNYAGFSEVAMDAYNANDFCGPADLPTASITPIDAEYVRNMMTDGVINATLTVENEYVKDGESYNVWGVIKGRDNSEAIMFGAHYDAYYKSFQDDTIAWAGVLAIAKAMIDSGVQPERDMIFCLHGAEEWGESDTAYDWAIGSYRQIFEARPEWQGKVLSFINFELPAYEYADYTYTQSAPESYAMIRGYTESDNSPKPVGVYKEGILTEGYQTYTYSDDFSYYIAGVPSFINGFLIDVKSEEGDVWDFYKDYYHTNYDTEATYNEAVLAWQLKFYGALGLYIDDKPALELDFTGQAERLAGSMDEAFALVAGADSDAYLEAVDAYAEAADALAAKVADVNGRYEAAGTDAEKEEIMAEGKALNALNLKIFRKTQDYLLGLSAEEPIVPHEWYQNNITLISGVIGLLEEGDVAAAADDIAWAINGALEWYAMAFDEAVYAHMIGIYSGEFASQNWAEGRVYEFADVEAATRSLVERYDEEGGDFSKEIKIYEEALAVQGALMKQMVADETGYIFELTEYMEAVAADKPLAIDEISNGSGEAGKKAKEVFVDRNSAGF